MSAKHCVIACDASASDGRYVVTIADHSRHGVKVNNRKISSGEAHRLEHDDVITLPFGMDYKFCFVDGGEKPITPPPAEASAKKTPGGGRKRPAGEKSAAKASAKKPSGAAGDGAGALNKRAKSSSPDVEDPSRKRLFEGAGGQREVANGGLEQIEEVKQLEAANVDLREKLRATAAEVDELRAELQRARDHSRNLQDAMDQQREEASTAAEELVRESRERAAAAEARAASAEAAAASSQAAAEAAMAFKAEAQNALDRATARREEAERRTEEVERTAREAAAALADAESRAAAAAAAGSEALEAENAALRSKLDAARAAAATSEAETRAARDEAEGLAEDLEMMKSDADVLAGKLATARAALAAAERRADLADHAAAPTRAAADQARARCEEVEERSRVMADRLAVARVAHAQAMKALQEVGRRLEVPHFPLELEGDYENDPDREDRDFFGVAAPPVTAATVTAIEGEGDAAEDLTPAEGDEDEGEGERASTPGNRHRASFGHCVGATQAEPVDGETDGEEADAAGRELAEDQAAPDATDGGGEERAPVREHPASERIVGMDVHFASEPPSEMPVGGGALDLEMDEPLPSSDPVPETEVANPAGLLASPSEMPPPPGRSPIQPPRAAEAEVPAAVAASPSDSLPDSAARASVGTFGAATQEAASVLGGDLAVPSTRGARRSLNGLLDIARNQGGSQPSEPAVAEEDEEEEQEQKKDEQDEVLVVENSDAEAEEGDDATAAIPPVAPQMITDDGIETERLEEVLEESDEEKEKEAADKGDPERGDPERGDPMPHTEMQGGCSESEVAAAVPMSFLEA